MYTITEVGVCRVYKFIPFIIAAVVVLRRSTRLRPIVNGPPKSTSTTRFYKYKTFGSVAWLFSLSLFQATFAAAFLAVFAAQMNPQRFGHCSVIKSIGQSMYAFGGVSHKTSSDPMYVRVASCRIFNRSTLEVILGYLWKKWVMRSLLVECSILAIGLGLLKYRLL